MFALARGIIRHKVGTVAVICIAVFFFSNDKDEKQASNNPWAVQAAAPTVASEPSMVDTAIDASMAYLEEVGVPIGEAGQTAERLDNTAAAVTAANRNN